MKKKKVTGAIVCAVVIVTAIVGGVFWKTRTTSYATSDNQAISKVEEYQHKDTKAKFGSPRNPFTILEIVPSIRQAEIGYMIKGCEPVDLKAALNDVSAYSDLKSQLAHESLPEELQPFEFNNGERRKVFGDQVPDGSKVYFKDMGQGVTIDKGHLTDDYKKIDHYENYNVYRWEDSALEQTGYYQKVSEGSGKFALIVNGSTDIPQSPDELSDANCKFEYREGGNYIWVEAENTDDIATDYTSDQVWTKRKENVHYEIEEMGIKNKDCLIKQVYNTTSDKMTSQVITLQSDDFKGNAQAKKIIEEADLIYIHGPHDGAGNGSSGTSKVWDQYHKTSRTDASSAKSFKENDIDWDTIMCILKRMAGKNPCGLVVDEPNAIQGFNTSKLYFSLIQYAPRVFYETFADKIQTVESSKSSSGTTGMFVKSETEKIDGKWDQNTFLTELGDGVMQVRWLQTGEYEIRDKVFTYRGNEVLWQELLKDTIKEYHNQETGGQNTEAFDYFEEKEGTRPDGISGNEAVEYILRNKVKENRKKKLKILEIEPCSTFIYKNDKKYPNWKLYFLSLFPWLEGSGEDGAIDWDKDIEVRTMASYEFVGNVDDLNAEYDLILFGPTRDATNGANGTNDETMKDLYYSASGDKVNEDSELRYTGNDITQKKLHELNSYLRAGKPIVVDGTYYEDKSTTVDEKKIEKNSNIYLMMNYANDAQKTTYFVRGAYLTTGRLEQALGDEQCKIVIEQGPQEYAYTENEDGTIAGGTIPYVKELTYQIKIIGPEGAMYDVNLYGDTNSDGIYTGSLKEQIELADNGKTTSKTENILTQKNIKANTPVIIKRKLGKNFKGVLPWKIEANLVGNQDVRDSEIGYAAVKPADGKKITIKVLQMNTNLKMTGQGVGGNGNIDFSDVQSQAGKLFKQYTDTLPDHKIEMDFMKNDDWREKYGDTGDAQTDATRLQKWEEYIQQYDMLVFGFMDQAQYVDSPIFQQAVQDFIAGGKSVIFSHDMVRDDTFKGAEYGDEKEISNYDDWLREACGQKKRTYNQVTQLLEPKSDNHMDNATRLFRKGYRSGIYADRSNVNGGPPPESNGQLKNYITRYVGVANRSQLTEYPYDIPDVIATSITHGQNHQLDFEQRDQGDVAVWYNLTDSHSTRYYSELSKEGFDLQGEAANDNDYVYSARECDSGNNFYIYNSGNVTYTGVGHANDMTVDEVKLFINTMIAAYRATPEPPDIDITNDDVITNENNYTLYITADDQIDQSMYSLPVNLKVNDDSVVNGKTYKLKIEEKLEDGSYRLYDSATHPLYVGQKQSPDAAWIDGTRADGQMIQPGPEGQMEVTRNGEYYFEVPYPEILDKGKKELRVTLISNYKNNGNSVTTTTISNITILQVGLYDLN